MPVTFLHHEEGPLQHSLSVLNLTPFAVKSWPRVNETLRLSRPWHILQARRAVSAFFKKNLGDVSKHLVFYEGDYQEPFLHAVLAKLALKNQLYRFAYSGHDIVDFPSCSFRQRLQIHMARIAWGCRFFPKIQPGAANSHCLHFFDSASHRVQALDVPLNSKLLSDYMVPLDDKITSPCLLLLESSEEEAACLDYSTDMNRLLDRLESCGWHIVAKGHPRLGSSQTILKRGIPLLDHQLPLELFDLSRVDAVMGLCSSGMFSSSEAGIPTYSVEKLVRRVDPARQDWAINFLSKDPGWNSRPIRISILEEWRELDQIRPHSK